MSRIVVALLSCAAASAQIPFDHLVYVHRTPNANFAAMGIIDPQNGTRTEIVPQAGSLLAHGSRTVAIDPQAPNVLYSVTSLATSIAVVVPTLTLTGNRFTRTNLQANLGAPGSPFHLRFAPGYGLLLLGRGGQVNRMFLRNMATNAVISQPTPTLLPNLASDMVFLGGNAYASSEGDGVSVTTGTIVEWDLAANTDRIVGSGYPPLTALNAFNGQLIAGDSNGDLHLIDPVTGSAGVFLSLGLGAIRAIAVDSMSQVYIATENANTWSIFAAFAPTAPLYSSTAAIEDLEVGPTQAPTMLTFGSGCPGSNSMPPTLDFTAPPALGGTFGVTVDSALANTGAFLVLGTSRVADTNGPLPRDLAGLGMPGCTQYVDAVASLFALCDNSGAAQHNFALPNNPAFAGFRIPMQWLCIDPTANTFGATTSSGGEAYAY